MRLWVDRKLELVIVLTYLLGEIYCILRKILVSD